MTLTGWHLGVALGVAALAGVGTGSFLAGWRKAQGLPTVEASADAGVRLTVDAGVSAGSDCAATVEHWTTIRVPGPIRYVVVDGGSVAQPPEVITLVVPDVSLRGSGTALAAFQSDATASAGSVARVAVPEPSMAVLWGLAPGVQHDTTYRPTVNAQLGLRWPSGLALSIGGGLDPFSTSNWNASLWVGGTL